jgi:hypothetical protein
MGGIMYYARGEKMHTEFLLEKLKGKENLEDLRVDRG